MKCLGVQPLSAKNLRHPHFQEQDNRRVQKYIRDQQSGLRMLETSEATAGLSNGKLAIDPGSAPNLAATGFASPVLQPRAERIKHDNERHFTGSNVSTAVKKSQEKIGRQRVHSDDDNNRSTHLETRRTRREIQRKIMREKSPQPKKKNVMPNLAGTSYSELGLLRRSPPLNIKSGRLTLKSKTAPGFFSKGKSSTKVRTTESKMPDLHSDGRPASSRNATTRSPGVIPVAIREAEDTTEPTQMANMSNHPAELCQSKLDIVNRGTIKENARSSSSVILQPRSRYSDVWDIEVEKSLPSDASSIRCVGSSSRKPLEIRELSGNPELPYPTSSAQEQHGPYEPKPHPDHVFSFMQCKKPVEYTRAGVETPSTETFCWMPYSSQQVPQTNDDMRYQELEDDIYLYCGPQEQLLDNLNFNVTNSGPGELQEVVRIQSNDETCADTFEVLRPKTNASNSHNPFNDDLLKPVEWDYYERYEDPWSKIEYGTYADDITHHSDPYHAPCHNAMNDNISDYETEGGFDVSSERRMTECTSPGPITCPSQELDAKWMPKPMAFSSIEEVSDTGWDSDKELKRILQNHWQPQKF